MSDELFRCGSASALSRDAADGPVRHVGLPAGEPEVCPVRPLPGEVVEGPCAPEARVTCAACAHWQRDDDIPQRAYWWDPQPPEPVVSEWGECSRMLNSHGDVLAYVDASERDELAFNTRDIFACIEFKAKA